MVGAELPCPVTPVTPVNAYGVDPNGMAISITQAADSVNVQVASIYKFEPNITFPDAGAPATTTRAGMVGLMVMELTLQELALAAAHTNPMAIAPAY